MANKFPYIASAGPLVRTIEQLRKSFPKEVNAETLKKLGVAPKNESFVINTLRFLGVIDDQGKKVDAKAKAFFQKDEQDFQREFSAIVKEAYEELFELRGDAAWTIDRAGLIQFFRNTDHSSDIVGSRQAGTFSCLAGLSGHADVPQPRDSTPKPKVKSEKPTKVKPGSGGGGSPATSQPDGRPADSRVGLTVRIEVNLPANGDQETYDNIFRSIRKNLIDGE